MCQIIHRLKDTAPIEDKILAGASRFNHDGWGIMYYHNSSLVVEKSLKMEDSVEAIRKAEDLNVEFAAHFRLGTHGTKGIVNTHPFPFFDDKYALVHNGIFNAPYDRERSDTALFVDAIGSLPHNVFELDSFVHFLHNLMKHSSNRIAIIYPTGSIARFGQWYNIPNNDKYKNKLLFSTAPTSYDYDPRNRTNFHNGYGGYNYGNNNPIGDDYDRMSDNIYSKKDEFDPDAIQNKLYRIGSVSYHLEDLIEFGSSDLSKIISEDPKGAADLFIDLITYAYVETSTKK